MSRLNNFKASSASLRRLARPHVINRAIICLAIIIALHTTIGDQFLLTCKAHFLNSYTFAAQYLNSFCKKVSYSIKFLSENLEDHINQLTSENIYLRMQLDKLMSIQTENVRLKQLLNITLPAPLTKIGARVISHVENDFSRAIIIDAGENKGIEKNDTIINHQGLIGRVIQVNQTSSTILLITDASSNVPVQINNIDLSDNNSYIQAILTGNHNNLLKISILATDTAIPDKALAACSGYGGMFVAGLKIGITKKIQDEFYVVPFVNFDKLDYVCVIKNGETNSAKLN